MAVRINRLTLVIGFVALAVVATVAMAGIWTSIGGAPLSIHGWVAMALGISGTVALAWVLMALAFRSDRDGWDDRADNVSDDETADPKTPTPPET